MNSRTRRVFPTPASPPITSAVDEPPELATTAVSSWASSAHDRLCVGLTRRSRCLSVRLNDNHMGRLRPVRTPPHHKQGSSLMSRRGERRVKSRWRWGVPALNRVATRSIGGKRCPNGGGRPADAITAAPILVSGPLVGPTVGDTTHQTVRSLTSMPLWRPEEVCCGRGPAMGIGRKRDLFASSQNWKSCSLNGQRTCCAVSKGSAIARHASQGHAGHRGGKPEPRMTKRTYRLAPAMKVATMYVAWRSSETRARS